MPKEERWSADSHGARLRCFAPTVSMMKTAEPGARDDHRSRRGPVLGWPVVGRVLLKRIVNAVFLVIGNVVAHQPAEMALIQRDDMIKKLPAGTADPAFRDSILPGRLHARPFWLQTVAMQECRYFGIEFRIVIQNDVPIRLIS